MENFHCFNCGHELIEIGMGFYECDNCGSQFLPTQDDKGLQKMTCTHYESEEKDKKDDMKNVMEPLGFGQIEDIVKEYTGFEGRNYTLKLKHQGREITDTDEFEFLLCEKKPLYPAPLKKRGE